LERRVEGGGEEVVVDRAGETKGSGGGTGGGVEGGGGSAGRECPRGREGAGGACRKGWRVQGVIERIRSLGFGGGTMNI
jgi:hypothetical protein